MFRVQKKLVLLMLLQPWVFIHLQDANAGFRDKIQKRFRFFYYYEDWLVYVSHSRQQNQDHPSAATR
jgi:hypothetical protein